MAICTLNRNILRTTSCGYSLNTITDLYLANYADVEAAGGSELGSDSGSCEVVESIGDSGLTWYHIEPAKGSTSFSDELVVADNGAKYRTHSITFTLNGEYDGCTHLDFDALSLGRYFVVAKTGSGNYIALGRTAGMEAETAVLNGSDDNNGMEITLSANVAESAVPLADAAVTALLAHVAA